MNKNNLLLPLKKNKNEAVFIPFFGGEVLDKLQE